MFLAFKLSNIVTVPFGWLMGWLYQVTNNYGIAMILFALAVFGVVMFIRLLILVFRALHKYLNSSPQRQEETILRRSLGEVLKEHRTRCGMTQEFVAESMGVSRQAVNDNLTRTEALLRRMEENIGCVKRDKLVRKAARDILDSLLKRKRKK